MNKYKILLISLLYSESVLICCALIITSPTTSIRKKLVLSSGGVGQIQGEVIVQSATLTVRGPPKGFPLLRHRRDTASNSTSTVTEASLDVRHGNNKKKGKKSKKKGGIMKKFMPYMFVPAMMSIGFAPLLLSNLKMFVMSAFMINMMAFNAAIFMTLRNMVFGPRSGEHIKYYNFGYGHNKPRHPTGREFPPIQR